MENRSGLVVDTRVTPADGYGERDAALVMVADVPGGAITLGGDKGYDYPRVRRRTATPAGHAARGAEHDAIGGSAIDARTTRHPGYAISQRTRKRVEEVFGWLKTVGLLRKLRHRGGPTVDWIFRFAAAAYNLIRIRNLVYATG